MRPISKALFFSLVVLIFAFSPAIGEQPKPDPNLKVTNLKERDLLREKRIESIPGLRDRYPSIFNGIEPFPYTESFEHPPGRDFPYTNSTSNPLTPAEQRVMKAIIDDFLVNDDTTRGCDQLYPAIARDLSGSFVITWHDYRNGNWDIYAQRYNSSGSSMDSNFKVNDDAGTANQSSPAIATDGSGNFVITWGDYRSSYYGDIYAQRYNSSGTALDSNFKVNDDVGSAKQRYPAMAVDGSGNFVITWEDYRNGYNNPDIYAQRYNFSGTPLGSNFKVNDDVGSASQGSPAIAIDGSGNFVITWFDLRNGNPDIYAQRYNSSGTPLDTNFKVNDDVGSAIQYLPAIAMDGSGNFVIIWEDYRNGSDNPDIYAQRYNSSGTPLDANFKVNDDVGSVSQGSPAIAIDGSGNFVITWHEYRNGNWDIYVQRYNSSGTALGSNFKVNDDIGTADQLDPVIAMDGSGNFVITWEDYRNGCNNPDIYAQRYNFSGTPLGSNFKVNDDVGSVSQYLPAIAKDGSGNFVITWHDDRNFNYNIYAQRYNFSGTPLGSNFKVNDDVGNATQHTPVIAMDGSGNFIITWWDYRNGNSDIYAQRYNSSGTPTGVNFTVNDDTGTTDQGVPDIAMDGSGNFVITWYDTRNGGADIYAQRYNSSGTLLGSNFKVNDDVGTAWQYDPAIAMDGSGNFVITWYDTRNGNFDIYAQRYNSSGTPLGLNFKVNDDIGTAWQYDPAIAMDDSGRFVITWEDYRNGNADIYAQRYNSSGNPVGNNYLVPNPLYASFAQQYPAVATSGAKIYYTWQDNRRAKGWDIYAKSMYFLRGDANGDNKVNIADIVYLVSYLFKFGPEPKPELGIGDANCDGEVTVADIVYLVNYLFKFGPTPCP